MGRACAGCRAGKGRRPERAEDGHGARGQRRATGQRTQPDTFSRGCKQPVSPGRDAWCLQSSAKREPEPARRRGPRRGPTGWKAAGSPLESETHGRLAGVCPREAGARPHKDGQSQKLCRTQAPSFCGARPGSAGDSAVGKRSRTALQPQVPSEKPDRLCVTWLHLCDVLATAQLRRQSPQGGLGSRGGDREGEGRSTS